MKILGIHPPHCCFYNNLLSVFKTSKDPSLFWDKLCLADYLWLVENDICNKTDMKHCVSLSMNLKAPFMRPAWPGGIAT